MNMKVCQLYEYELYEYESQLTKTIISQNNLRKFLTIERFANSTRIFQYLAKILQNSALTSSCFLFYYFPDDPKLIFHLMLLCVNTIFMSQP